MKILLPIALLPIAALAQPFAQQGVRPAWAFPVADKDQPTVAEGTEARQIPGSAKSYTPAQIDDLLNPPDWFPNEHGTLPQIVMKGNAPNGLACGSCHLMSGKGHPESADIAGMQVGYLIRQMEDFKSGKRVDPARMNGIAKALTDQDFKAAAEWAASLKPGGWMKVVEADAPPKSYVSVKGRMRLPHPAGGTGLWATVLSNCRTILRGLRRAIPSRGLLPMFRRAAPPKDGRWPAPLRAGRSLARFATAMD